MNKALFTTLMFMLSVCIFSAIAGSVWAAYNWEDVWYLRLSEDSKYRNLYSILYNFTCEFVLIFADVFTFVITYSLMIPISLYVSIEIVHVFQAVQIDWDLEMYDDETQTAAKARTSNLSEELGQVSYIFADKTGTLTRYSTTARSLFANQFKEILWSLYGAL